MRKSLAVIALVALLGHPARADLVDFVDFGTYTLDTSTGLLWLDVTETLGLSYNDVVASDLYDSGWRHAMPEEICVLFGYLYGALSCSPGANYRILDTQDIVDLAVPTRDLFGYYLTGSATSTTHGKIDDGGDPTQVGFFNLGVFPPDTGFPGPPYYDLNFWVDVYSPDASQVSDGHWLVKPIPEPSTALLLGFGLVGLAAGRRRR
jgi:hypothetical protein